MVDHFIYYWTELLFVDCQLLQATPNSKKKKKTDQTTRGMHVILWITAADGFSSYRARAWNQTTQSLQAHKYDTSLLVWCRSLIFIYEINCCITPHYK